jgi:hypothetical protein
MLAVVVSWIPSGRLASFLVGVTIFGLSFMSCNLIAIITDVFPESTLGRVRGLTGTGEGIMKMVLTIATGAAVDRFSFAPVVVGAGMMPLLSVAALFLLVRRCIRVTFDEAGGVPLGGWRVFPSPTRGTDSPTRSAGKPSMPREEERVSQRTLRHDSLRLV